MLPYAHTLLADAYCSAGHVIEAADIIEELDKARNQNEIRYVDAYIAYVRDRLRAVA